MQRWAAGEATVERAVARLLYAVPGRLVLYTGLVFQDETECISADVDLMLITPYGIAVVGMTGSQNAAFTRRGNELVAHEGAARQVRNLSNSYRRMVASCVGRLALTAGMPIFPVLALEGRVAESLRSQPWFDLDGSVPVRRAIDVVEVADLGGYVRARLRDNPCRAESMIEIDRQLTRRVMASFDSRHTRPQTKPSTCAEKVWTR